MVRLFRVKLDDRLVPKFVGVKGSDMMKRHRHGWLVIVLILAGMYTARSIAPTRSVTSAAAPGQYSYIVFTLVTWPLDDQERTISTTDLYVIMPDGKQWANLTKGAYSLGGGTWAPDGKRLAFVMSPLEGESPASIYLMDADGSHLRPLTGDDTEDITPAWSPNGQYIAFMSSPPKGSMVFSIGTVRIRDGEITQLTPQEFSPSALSWSRDGRYLLYGVAVSGTQARPFWMDAKDGRIIDELFLDMAGYGENGSQPELSPDGARIVFIDWEASRIATVPTEGGTYSLLTPPPPPADFFIYDTSPTWSPDGEQVAFISNRGRDRENAGSKDLYIINADGTGLRRVTYLPPEMRAFSPDWSPWLDEPLDLDWEPTPWSVDAE